MIDLTSAGNRAMDTLDSVSDMQMVMRAAPAQDDFSAFMQNIKLSTKAMQAVDEYLKNPEHLKSLPLQVWHPVTNGEAVKFNVPALLKPCGSLSNHVFRNSDTRIFRASFSDLTIYPLVGLQIRNPGNDFL